MWHRQGRAKDSRRFSRLTNVAPHNRLKLLESRFAAAELNDSPYSTDVSSRRSERKVEFVNHPKAVSLGSARGGQSVRSARGWGAPFKMGLIVAHSRAVGHLERDQMAQVLA